MSVSSLFDKIDNGRKGKNIGLKTGIPKLDKYTGGIQKGRYTLVFGLSGSGKSSYVLYSTIYRPLRDYADKDIKLVYYSLEMSEEVLLAKLLCLYIYEEFNYVIPYTDLMSWQSILDDKSYEYVVKGRAWLEEIQQKLIIFDKNLCARTFYKSMMSLLETWGTFEESEDGRRKIYKENNPEQLVLVVVDHLGLCIPETGHTKKEEMDLISQYAVTLRERCQVSFYMLQQENRNSANMERRKADMTECSSEDLKDTGNPYNDCQICIGVYFPLKHKVKTHKGYPIITEDQNGFVGLRDRYRALCLIKNREGVSDRIIPVSFYGELGLFKEIPKPDEIQTFEDYVYLDGNYPDKEPQPQVTLKQEETPKSEFEFNINEFNF